MIKDEPAKNWSDGLIVDDVPYETVVSQEMKTHDSSRDDLVEMTFPIKGVQSETFAQNVLIQQRRNDGNWEEKVMPKKLRGMTKRERKIHILCFTALFYCIIMVAAILYVALFYEGMVPE